MYMKVPPAKELNTTSVSVLVPCKRSPRTIPIGVAAANTTRRKMPFRFSPSSTNYLVIELPRDIAAASLWQMRPIMMFSAAVSLLVSPKAIPSKMACMESAKTRTRLERPKPEQKPEVSRATYMSMISMLSSLLPCCSDLSWFLGLHISISFDPVDEGELIAPYFSSGVDSALSTRNMLGPSR